jgi:cytochrome b involved in lipid metabolism
MSIKTGPPRPGKVTWSELAQHSSPEDMWVAIEGRCYDVTTWKKTHPGGKAKSCNRVFWNYPTRGHECAGIRLLEFYAGRDATDPFLAYHPGTRARALMNRFEVGAMESSDPKALPATTVEYRRLAKHFETAGFYKTNVAHYVAIVSVLALLFASCWVLVAHGYLVLGALVLGIFWQQVW